MVIPCTPPPPSILTEGHKVKNPNMKLAVALRGVPSKLRVIISGTPIQNNLLEMHALFDYCCHGLLGTRRMFARCVVGD